jgi:hypothetical protein
MLFMLIVVGYNAGSYSACRRLNVYIPECQCHKFVRSQTCYHEQQLRRVSLRVQATAITQKAAVCGIAERTVHK